MDPHRARPGRPGDRLAAAQGRAHRADARRRGGRAELHRQSAGDCLVPGLVRVRDGGGPPGDLRGHRARARGAADATASAAAADPNLRRGGRRPRRGARA